ncbi:MAG: hypothetical protein E6Q79_00005, partial [Romboutsia sp.]
MKKYFLFFFVFLCFSVFSQNDDIDNKGLVIGKEIKPSIDLYKIYTLQKDTTFVDTSLTINSEYKYNFLRKDIFG